MSATPAHCAYASLPPLLGLVEVERRYLANQGAKLLKVIVVFFKFGIGERVKCSVRQSRLGAAVITALLLLAKLVLIIRAIIGI